MTVREFDPDSTAIDSLKFGDLASAPDYDGRYGSCVGRFLSDIFCKLSPAEEACGRLYQRQTIKSGGLTIISPFSGEASVSRLSFLVQGFIFYQFCEPAEYYVVAGRIKLGYPLLALFVPETNSLLKWEIENDKRTVTRIHLKKLAGILADQSAAPAFAAAKSTGRTTPTILFGHRNFAHHLWNELPALERLLTDGPLNQPPAMMVAREPLGAIDEIFPEVSRWTIIRRQTDQQSIVHPSSSLFVNLGSYRVSTSTRLRVLRHANARTTLPVRLQIEQIRKSGGPVFWLSVRLQNPTIINQAETLITIATRLIGEFRSCHILFDGFSPPDDWQSCNDDDRRSYSSAANASRCAIDEIIEKLLDACPAADPLRVLNVGGIGVLDSIALAQLASGYFCHVGTVQHKIGWTANTPGLVHSNRNILSRKSEIWYAPLRLENGIMPDPIEPDTVSAAGWHDNYSVLDAGRVATLVVDNFQRYVTSPQP